jgi:hypothetical protein
MAPDIAVFYPFLRIKRIPIPLARPGFYVHLILRSDVSQDAFKVQGPEIDLPIRLKKLEIIQSCIP